MAGLSYRGFIDALHERSIPALGYADDADLEQEMGTVRRLMRERQEQRGES